MASLGTKFCNIPVVVRFEDRSRVGVGHAWLEVPSSPPICFVEMAELPWSW